MSNPSPVDDIVTQYLAARGEAAQCRFTSDQFLTRAASADSRADALALVITTLGGEVPIYPPVADDVVEPEEGVQDSGQGEVPNG